jgi:two-component system LytT family response regulator
MIKLRTIIADDEPLLRQELHRKLESHPQIELIASCENGVDAVKAANELLPDLMFLDIVMPGLDGFGVVKAIQADVMPAIIFATAYDQYAIQAFDVRAIDYLVKPYSDERLNQSIETALLHRLDNPTQKKQAIIDLSLDISGKQVGKSGSSKAASGWRDQIVVENKDPQIVVSVNDIAWIDAAGDYMCIHANDETFIMRSTMKQLSKQLNPADFKRIHRSTIVNANFVESIEPFQKGDYFVHLIGGARLRLSRSYRDALQALQAKLDAPPPEH